MAQPAHAERGPGLEKAPTGISGLDEVLTGGLPRDRASPIVGGAGTGRAVLALQTLVRRRELRVTEAEAQARVDALRREIEGLRAELDLLHEQEQAQEARWTRRNQEVRDRRNADEVIRDAGPSSPSQRAEGQEEP